MANAALLATLGDQTASQTAGSISALMPPGVILPYGGSTPPTGWLLCDGSTISRTTYVNLFQAIGIAHGQGDGSTTFNLPDFRGRFMRGVDGSANRDPDKAARTAANTGGNTGNNVGSVQSNATARNGLSGSSAGMSANTTHGHGFSDPGHGHNHAQDTTQGYAVGAPISATSGAGGFQGGTFSDRAPTLWINGFVRSNTTGASVNASGSIDHSHGITISTGDNETRPLNINVNYIIKI